jgi:hypothetical protein
VIDGRYAIPFIERDGVYWGRPTDDAMAITELERLREAGARILVFGSNAFWWFEHYSGFADHVRDRYRCVAKDDHLVAFDMSEDPSA